LSIETYSTDESLLKMTARVDRIGRGEYAISAEIEFKYEPDENTMVRMCFLLLHSYEFQK